MKSYYLSHYFDPKNAAPFLLLSFLGLVIVLAIVLITAKIQVHQKRMPPTIHRGRSGRFTAATASGSTT